MTTIQPHTGANPGMLHVSGHAAGCRLAEALSRLMALQGARQLGLEPTFELSCLRELAGYAAVHLGVALEVGCGCPEGRAA